MFAHTITIFTHPTYVKNPFLFCSLAREYAQDNHHTYVEYLKRIQTLLIDISVAISNCNYNSPNSSPVLPTVSPSPLSIKGTSFSKRHAAELEEWIEEYSESLPPVEHFVIPVSHPNIVVYMLLKNKVNRTVKYIEFCFTREVGRYVLYCM